MRILAHTCYRYGTKHVLQPIPSEWLALWRQASKEQAAPAEADGL